jgi:hypothetical protein
MRRTLRTLVLAGLAASVLGTKAPAQSAAPSRGGILNFAVVAQNGDILPTNNQLKPGSPTAIIRASAKWCKSDGGSKAAALSSSLCCSLTARSRACRRG